jgi:hypothetical protein
MKMIGRVTLLVLACLGASACASSNPPLVDRGNCDSGSKLPVAIIMIYEDPETGMPAASPAACHVAAGSRVEFVTKVDARRGFTIEFDKGDGSPAANGDGKFVGVKKGAGAFEAEILKIRDFPGDGKNQFNYSIVIGSKKTDPSIIIDQ